jgi:hypothetical protein
MMETCSTPSELVVDPLRSETTLTEGAELESDGHADREESPDPASPKAVVRRYSSDPFAPKADPTFERVFGSRRRDLLEEELKGVGKAADTSKELEIVALRKAVEDLETRQARQVQALENDDDPGGMMFRRIRERLAELERQRLDALDKLRKLEAAALPTQPGNVDLLDELPLLDQGLSGVSEDLLRPVLEALRLTVRYDKAADHARVQVAISEESLDEVLAALCTLAFSAPILTVYEPFPLVPRVRGSSCRAVPSAPGTGA